MNNFVEIFSVAGGRTSGAKFQMLMHRTSMQGRNPVGDKRAPAACGALRELACTGAGVSLSGEVNLRPDDPLGASSHEEEDQKHRNGHAQEPEENPAGLSFLLTLPKGLEFCFHNPESGPPANGMDQR